MRNLPLSFERLVVAFVRPRKGVEMAAECMRMHTREIFLAAMTKEIVSENAQHVVPHSRVQKSAR